MRPTTDRVREAIGNRLQSMGALEGARIVDLFAGTGALGIEALSRGAAHVTFVEQAPAALDALNTNLETLGFTDQATVVRSDALHFSGGPFDIAFIDPPYTWDGWRALLENLDAQIVLCEARGEVELPEPWRLVRSDRYGTTVVTLGQRGSS